jgi:ABC-2 type transport system permease protein
MRNVWLILKREYRAWVFTRAFWFTTLLMPLLVSLLLVIPARLASYRLEMRRSIVVVASRAEFGEMLRQQLTEVDESNPTAVKFQVRVSTNATDAERESLRAQVAAGAIDGYLWATDDALAARKVLYSSRGVGDFMEWGGLRVALQVAMMREELRRHGAANVNMQELLRPFDLQTARVEQGTERRWSGRGMVVMTVLLVTSLYGVVLMYGVILMRSVLEEKASRIVEVLLSSVSSRQLMAGKILGVGLVGMTQMGIWALMGVAVLVPAMAKWKDITLQVPATAVLFFPVFFVLGYLLYAGLWAVLAAITNSEQEAYQLQTLVMLPLLVSIILVFFVIRRPEATASIWLSMVPFFAPLLMYVRILVEMPPAWQIVLCLALLTATTWGLLGLCARIYRIGILMYGKRPTLAEVWRWTKYA